LTQVNDESVIISAVDKVIAANEKAVADFRAGQEKSFGFLVGKIVDVGGGKYVTIFDPKFAPFNAGPGKQSQIENIQKEDPDYYTDISDNIHADETVIKNGILAVTGSGAFQMKERAGYYAERLIQVYKEHKAKGLNTAAENFRSIIKPKLEAWLDFWYRDTRSQSLVGERFGKGNTDLQGKSIVVTLVKEGLIDFRLIEDAYHGKIKAHKGFVDSFIVEYFKEEPDVGKNLFPAYCLLFTVFYLLFTKLKNTFRCLRPFSASGRIREVPARNYGA
jgi:hypothetical protein